MAWNDNTMLILLPFVIIIAIIVAIDYMYYSDVKHDVVPPKEVQQSTKEANTTSQYLDKYIKK